MGRQSCCYGPKIRKGLWSPEEDEKLLNHVSKYGHGCWSSVPKLAGLQRCGKSCRLRWINYLRPDLKRGAFSRQEENKIIELHSVLGNRWSQIATHLPGRTDNEIKNFWNTNIRKKLKKQGIDPISHKPISGAAENNTEMLPHASITENNTEMPSSCPEKMISLLEIEESRPVFCDDRKQKQYFTLEASSSTACRPSGFIGSFSFDHWNYYESTLCFDSVSVFEKPSANINPSDNASLPRSWGLQDCVQQYSFALLGDTTTEDVDWCQELQSPPFLVQTESPQPILTGTKPEMNPSSMECHRDKNFQGSSYAYGNEFDMTSLAFEQHMFLK